MAVGTIIDNAVVLGLLTPTANLDAFANGKDADLGIAFDTALAGFKANPSAVCKKALCAVDGAGAFTVVLAGASTPRVMIQPTGLGAYPSMIGFGVTPFANGLVRGRVGLDADLQQAISNSLGQFNGSFPNGVVWDFLYAFTGGLFNAITIGGSDISSLLTPP